MKKILLPVILALAIQPAFAQMRFLPKFVRKMLFEQDSSKHSSYFILPVLSSAPETGIEAGGSVLYSFYTDTVNPATRVSNIFGYATATTKGQSRFSISTNYWTPGNRYHITAAVSYINFPFDYYGVGNNTLKQNQDRLGHKRFKGSVTGEKYIGGNFYLGLTAGLQHFAFEDDKPGGIYETLPASAQPKGGTLLLAGPSIVFDNRNNVTYTTKGAVVNAYFNFIKGIYRENDYRGGFFNIEYAQFFPLSKRWVIGLNAQQQTLVGNRQPFYMLPSLGNDEIMRGYYNGRFRDKNLLAAQTELRYRISDRFGVVGFAGAGKVYADDFNFENLKPSYGLGGRYFFDVEKGLSMRVDYAIGEKRPGENRQTGFYMSLGESF